MTMETTTGTCQKSAFMTALADTSTQDLEGAGTTRRDQFGKSYRWVMNDSTVAARVGAPALYDETDVAQTYFLQRCIMEDQAAGDVKYLAGIWLAAVAAQSYGWIQTFGPYGTARMAAASAGAVVAGDLMVPNVSTDTTGTAASKPYCFTTLFVQGATIATAAGQLDGLFNPKVIAMGAVTNGSDDATVTVPSTVQVFVKGLI